MLTGASIVVFALLSQPIITSWLANKKVLFVAVLSATNSVSVGASRDLNVPVGVNLYLPALAANVNLGAPLNVMYVAFATLLTSTTSNEVVFPANTILSPAANAGDVKFVPVPTTILLPALIATLPDALATCLNTSSPCWNAVSYTHLTLPTIYSV